MYHRRRSLFLIKLVVPESSAV
jgi:hypothetical protein